MRKRYSTHVPVLSGTEAECAAAGFVHKTVSKAESIGALAPSLRSWGEWDTAADDPERPSAKKENKEYY